MTGLPSKKFRLAGRGVLREGNHADITIFDADTIIDAADFQHSVQPAVGIDTVIVNGEIVWCDGKATGKRPGRVLLNRGGQVTAH
jgi:N-acyl-D-amino-acid deacylase